MGERVGFIGLGIMGAPMARHLLAAGFPLTVHSRSSGPVDALVEAGAARAESPAELARASDVVVTMLPDTPDVERVMIGDDGVIAGAAAGSLAIDMSTIDPGPTRAIAEQFATHDVEMLDAPVSGGERGAIDGTLSIMVGGSDAAFARAKPILEAMGKNIVHVGPSGAGQITKACNQLVVAATIEAVAEALVLAERSGVDAAKVREALLGGFAGSKILEVHGQRMLDRAFEPGFRARLHRKDARIVLDAAQAAGSPIPAFEVVAAQLDHLVDDAIVATWTTRRCSRCWTKPDASDGSGGDGRLGPALRPRTELVDHALEVAALVGQVVLGQDRGRRRDVASDDPSASSCFNRSDSSVSEMGATSSRMSENRVAPASMALTINVLQRFPSRSAARWKCTQIRRGAPELVRQVLVGSSVSSWASS